VKNYFLHKLIYTGQHDDRFGLSAVKIFVAAQAWVCTTPKIALAAERFGARFIASKVRIKNKKYQRAHAE
jgi:hypothetical protein